MIYVLFFIMATPKALYNRTETLCDWCHIMDINDYVECQGEDIVNTFGFSFESPVTIRSLLA